MSWLGERAALPDHMLLGSGRCSAFRCPDLLCGVGPAGPAPAHLPSPHPCGRRSDACSQHPTQGLKAWGRKRRQVWERTLAPVSGVDVSAGYQPSLRDLPSPGTCLRLPLPPLRLCVPMPCLINAQPKDAPLQHKIMHMSCSGLTLPGREVKPDGDAYSLSSVDGAKSCCPSLSLRDDRSLLKLLLGANEAAQLPVAECLLLFRKIKCPMQNPDVFYHLFIKLQN